MTNQYFVAGGDRAYTPPVETMTNSMPILSSPPQPFDLALRGVATLETNDMTAIVPPPWYYDVSLLLPEVERMQLAVNSGLARSYMQVIQPIEPVSSAGV